MLIIILLTIIAYAVAPGPMLYVLAAYVVYEAFVLAYAGFVMFCAVLLAAGRALFKPRNVGRVR